MIITIDGPAGTGKSTVAQAVARELGYDFLDTGAMYRALGLAVLRAGVKLDDYVSTTDVAQRVNIDFDFSHAPPRILLDGHDVARHIRDAQAATAASLVAVIPEVRSKMVAEQRRIALQHGKLVTEGRDQGSVVFPDAELKIYLDATPSERARRRAEQLRLRGQRFDEALLLEEINSRDARDAGRSVGPLRRAAGAVVIDTTAMTESQVISRIVSMASSLTFTPQSIPV